MIEMSKSIKVGLKAKVQPSTCSAISLFRLVKVGKYKDML